MVESAKQSLAVSAPAHNAQGDTLPRREYRKEGASGEGELITDNALVLID